MPNAHLSRVSGVEPSVAQALQGSNLSSTRDVLLLNVVDLMELLNITHSQALQLQQAVSACVCPAFTTVSGGARAAALHVHMHATRTCGHCCMCVCGTQYTRQASLHQRMLRPGACPCPACVCAYKMCTTLAVFAEPASLQLKLSAAFGTVAPTG